MINLNDVLIQKEYREGRRAEARHHRLIQVARGIDPRRNPITHRLMARLGDLFVAWGQRLQARYGKFLNSADGSQSGSRVFIPNRLAAETSAESQPCG